MATVPGSIGQSRGSDPGSDPTAAFSHDARGALSSREEWGVTQTVSVGRNPHL